jgi:hypothetical protein
MHYQRLAPAELGEIEPCPVGLVTGIVPLTLVRQLQEQLIPVTLPQPVFSAHARIIGFEAELLPFPGDGAKLFIGDMRGANLSARVLQPEDGSIQHYRGDQHSQQHGKGRKELASTESPRSFGTCRSHELERNRIGKRLAQRSWLPIVANAPSSASAIGNTQLEHRTSPIEENCKCDQDGRDNGVLRDRTLPGSEVPGCDGGNEPSHLP